MNIVLVTAIWCPSCIIMRPRYQKIFKEMNINFKELDFDDDEQEVDKLHIGKTLPVCIVYKDNEEKQRIIGEKNEKEINRIIKSIQ